MAIFNRTNLRGPLFVCLALAVVFGIAGFWPLYSYKPSDEAVRRQIGQMLVVGFRGTQAEDSHYIFKAIKDLNLGGVVLFDIDGPTKNFPRNIVNAGQLRELISSLKKHSATPLLVAVDAEGGFVNRLKPKYGFIPIPGHRQLAEYKDLSRTRQVSAELAEELSGLGFNVNFAPSVDVDVNPLCPVIGALGRSFSADAKIVTEQARAFIDGQHQNGILTSIKHFPGHGSSKNDSHKGLTDVSLTYQSRELFPFKELIRAGVVDLVMTAHIMNKQVDAEYPATLSRHFIREILRKKLGFKGVVISDDMQMGAITKQYGFREALVRAVNAGCDLLIISNNGAVYDEKAPYEACDLIFEAVKKKEISLKRITESSLRIQRLKEGFGVRR